VPSDSIGSPSSQRNFTVRTIRPLQLLLLVVSSADSESIDAVTANRKRLEQGNERAAGLRVQDWQSDQEGIDDALLYVVAPSYPVREESISHS
jgi:hypothetical protein